MDKKLYMLIGPKGSGKTYIGTLVENRIGIPFLRVENIWLALAPGEDGWQKVEEAVDRVFKSCDELMIENLGAGEGFDTFHASLNQKYRIKLIRVFSDPDLCLARIRKRDRSNHIPVSDSKVREYNKIAAQVTLNWALEINNNGPASDTQIIRAFKGFQGKTSADRGGPDPGKGHDKEEGRNHAGNGELFDSADAKPCGQHDHSAASREIGQHIRGCQGKDQGG